MATRWKREPTTVLLQLHEHNRMSRYYDYLLRAASSLGLIIGYRVYANHYDRSTDREWYCMSHQVETAGGLAAIRGLAENMRDQDDLDASDCEP